MSVTSDLAKKDQEDNWEKESSIGYREPEEQAEQEDHRTVDKAQNMGGSDLSGLTGRSPADRTDQVEEEARAGTEAERA